MGKCEMCIGKGCSGHMCAVSARAVYVQVGTVVRYVCELRVCDAHRKDKYTSGCIAIGMW